MGKKNKFIASRLTAQRKNDENNDEEKVDVTSSIDSLFQFHLHKQKAIKTNVTFTGSVLPSIRTSHRQRICWKHFETSYCHSKKCFFVFVYIRCLFSIYMLFSVLLLSLLFFLWLCFHEYVFIYPIVSCLIVFMMVSHPSYCIDMMSYFPI